MDSEAQRLALYDALGQCEAHGRDCTQVLQWLINLAADERSDEMQNMQYDEAVRQALARFARWADDFEVLPVSRDEVAEPHLVALLDHQTITVCNGAQLLAALTRLPADVSWADLWGEAILPAQIVGHPDAGEDV